MSDTVCFSLDDYISDKDETFWTALLSDGRSVYQDEGRPGQTEPSAWIRLQNYCKENNLYVKSMYITFRSHTERMTESNEGWFFRKGVLSWGGSGKTSNFFITGPIVNNKIYVTKWRVPEIIIEESEIRDIDNNEDGIIWNLNHQVQKNHVQNLSI